MYFGVTSLVGLDGGGQVVGVVRVVRVVESLQCFDLLVIKRTKSSFSTVSVLNFT